MFTVIVFETVEELVAAKKDGTIPASVYLVHDDGKPRLSGEGADRFELSRDMTWDVFLEVMCKMSGLRVHFT